MAKKAKARGVISYKSYVFVDKDPVIDAIRTAMEDANMSAADVEAKGGPKAGTLYGWFHRNTKRPQHVTVAATARILGKGGIRWTRNGCQLLD